MTNDKDLLLYLARRVNILEAVVGRLLVIGQSEDGVDVKASLLSVKRFWKIAIDNLDSGQKEEQSVIITK